MRITKLIEKIDYNETKIFFQNRAKKYSETNPYSVTMYQDDHPDLAKQRNAYEIAKLKSLLTLNPSTRILDLACGIGRWAEQIEDNIACYYGMDFAENLINIARQRNKNPKKQFVLGSITNIQDVLGDKQFNCFLLMGVLLYLNDDDITKTMLGIEKASEKHSTICIRGPIAINERLTLKDFYSDELKADYNAIYRTRSELIALLQEPLLEKGFSITNEGFLYDNDPNLNNRSETAQYYIILQR